jgi:hypothetical protein
MVCAVSMASCRLPLSCVGLGVNLTGLFTPLDRPICRELSRVLNRDDILTPKPI